MAPRDHTERSADERAAKRTEELIAALARPPRKAAPRGIETRENDNSEALPADSQSAYNAQLLAFARSVSRVR